MSDMFMINSLIKVGLTANYKRGDRTSMNFELSTWLHALARWKTARSRVQHIEFDIALDKLDLPLLQEDMRRIAQVCPDIQTIFPRFWIYGMNTDAAHQIILKAFQKQFTSETNPPTLLVDECNQFFVGPMGEHRNSVPYPHSFVLHQPALITWSPIFAPYCKLVGFRLQLSAYPGQIIPLLSGMGAIVAGLFVDRDDLDLFEPHTSTWYLNAVRHYIGPGILSIEVWWWVEYFTNLNLAIESVGKVVHANLNIMFPQWAAQFQLQVKYYGPWR